MILENIFSFLQRKKKEEKLWLERYAENFSDTIPSNSTVTLFSFQVPVKMKMRLLSFGNYMDHINVWGKVTWTFLVNGIPLYPYNAIKDQLAQGAERQVIKSMEIYGGGSFEVKVKNEAVIPVKAGISLEYELESWD